MRGTGYSWVQAGECTFFARSQGDWGAAGFHPECHGSMNRLIAGIYERDPRWARRIVRHRIHTNEPVSESSWGTLKVAARRAEFHSSLPPSGFEAAVEIGVSSTPLDEVLKPWIQERAESAGEILNDSVWSFLDALIAQAQQLPQRIVALPVSAVLLDERGRVLSWGMNSAWDFRTQHAEVNLIRRWREAGSPGEPRELWVTRKSCKMCAGWIWDSWRRELESGSLTVRFRDPDDGPMARNTVLDEGSFERRRAMTGAGVEHASG